MIEHRCSIGTRGGFFQRLAAGDLSGPHPRTCHLGAAVAGWGRYRLRPRPRDLRGRRLSRGFRYMSRKRWRGAAWTPARELVLAAIHDRPFDVKAESQKLRDLAHEVLSGTEHAGDRRCGRTPRHSHATLEHQQPGAVGARSRSSGAFKPRRPTAPAPSPKTIAQDKELTRMLLAAVGVPVPEGRPVSDADDAWAAAEEIGVPVVVKPRDGNQGRGVATNLTTREQIAAAYQAALQERQASHRGEVRPGPRLSRAGRGGKRRGGCPPRTGPGARRRRAFDHAN